jgi:DNA invertase Pin-like site-specific DNA recombinase
MVNYGYSWRLLARATRDLPALAEILNRAGVGLCSLESRTYTASPFGKMALIVFVGIDEFERLIAERTSSGRLAVQEIGVRFATGAFVPPSNRD